MVENTQVELLYSEAKSVTKNILRSLINDIHCLTKKDDGCNKLAKIMNHLGIKSKCNGNTISFIINEKSYYNKSLNKLAGINTCAKCKTINACKIYFSLPSYTEWQNGKKPEFFDKLICRKCKESLEKEYNDIINECYEELAEMERDQIRMLDKRAMELHPNWKLNKPTYGYKSSRYIDENGNIFSADQIELSDEELTKEITRRNENKRRKEGNRFEKMVYDKEMHTMICNKEMIERMERKHRVKLRKFY